MKLGKQSAISPGVNTIHQTPPLTRSRLCIILALSHDPIQRWLVSFSSRISQRGVSWHRPGLNGDIIYNVPRNPINYSILNLITGQPTDGEQLLLLSSQSDHKGLFQAINYHKQPKSQLSM